MLKLGDNVGVRARTQRGNNILCVCGTNVDLYIQWSCASKRCRARVDQSPWSGVRTQGGPVASILTFMESKSGASSPTFRLKFPPLLDSTPLGSLLRV